MLYPIELRVRGHIVTQTYLGLGLRLYLPGETPTGIWAGELTRRFPQSIFANWASPIGLRRLAASAGGSLGETSVLST